LRDVTSISIPLSLKIIGEFGKSDRLKSWHIDYAFALQSDIKMIGAEWPLMTEVLFDCVSTPFVFIFDALTG
jgi:hypothetical protein